MSIGIGSSMNESSEYKPDRFRTHGLPPNEATGQYLGFAADGRAFVLKWSTEFGVWGACGWDVADPNYSEVRPLVVACREDMADFIVSHAKLNEPLQPMQHALKPVNVEAEVRKLIEDNPEKAAQAREKPSLEGWFVGQVMKATGGKANPVAVRDQVASMLAATDQ